MKTDKGGRFKVRCWKVHRAFAIISKDDYEATDRVGFAMRMDTSRNDPAICLMRKKGDAAFLAIYPSDNSLSEFLFLAEKTETPYVYSLDIAALLDRRKKPSGYADVTATASFDEAGGCWIAGSTEESRTGRAVPRTSRRSEAAP